MKTANKTRKPKLTPIEKMIVACVGFDKDEKTLKQVWYALRGHQNFMRIQEVADRELGGLLFHLALDFQSWHGERDDLIEESIRRVAEHVGGGDRN